MKVIMTEFRIENLTIPSAEFNGVTSLPSISEELRLSFMQDVFELHEDDELFVNYGMVDYGFPYKVQDNYTRELKDKEQVTVVMENEYLKATFLPQFGGKLHSLFDKKKQEKGIYLICTKDNAGESIFCDNQYDILRDNSKITFLIYASSLDNSTKYAKSKL